jgi:hypothetical protein
MNAKLRMTIGALSSVLAILVLAPISAGHAQAPTPPTPATPFDGPNLVSFRNDSGKAPATPTIGDAFQRGASRLTGLQNNDGGWDWPLYDGDPTSGSAPNTIGPIGMGLAQAYLHTSDASHRAALEKVGAFLMAKTNTFSPSDGYLAAALDSIFGGTDYVDHVNTYFYGPLAAGTYNRNGAGTLYGTASYIQLIRNARHGSGIGNLAAWDIGMGLVGAAAAGADTAPWIAGVEAEINLLDGSQYYDVLGLAGAVYGLAYVGEDFDPTSGQHAMASNLAGLGTILASYQLPSGGFTWNMGYRTAGNESNQETAYAILALEKLNHSAYLPSIVPAADYLYSVQLGTGGWNGYPGDPEENNEVTGEALWAIATAYQAGDVWVCTSGDCGHPEASFNVIQDGINAVQTGGTVHILAGTYTEQLSITKAMNLSGEGPGAITVQSPDTLSTCFGTKKPIICVKGVNANITNLTVDGDGKGNVNSQFIGIAYYNASGTIDNNNVIHVRETPLSGNGNGVSIYANNADASARTLHVTNNTTSDYEKNGVALAGDGLTVDVHSNAVVGAGPTGTIAQNGIQVGFGAGGTITGNDVSNNAWTGTYGGSNDPVSDASADGAAGILLYHPGSPVEISGNNLIHENQFGVWSVGATAVNIHNNQIHGLGHTGSAFPTAIAIWSEDQWGSYFGFSEAGTAATVNNNILEGNDYNLLVRDYTAGGPAPSVTASGNNFTHARIQVASNDGTINIPLTLSNNTFDLSVTVSGSPYLPFIWSGIQDAVDAAAPDDTVHVGAGTYVDNVTIPKTLTIEGSSQAMTKVVPAVSNPNPCEGSSLCGGAASNVFLVQANDVTIHDLTVDGNNPDLTSGVIRPLVGGVDIDARNGIIANNANPAIVYSNLIVHHVTVQNVYLRGIYQATGSFNFHDNTVTNVQGDYYSIGMFAWYGPGTFESNTVSWANDAISSNHSKGIHFVNNVVTHSGSGVHTDNAGETGGPSDLIQDNTISDCMPDGYGIFVFAPYIAPTVNHNHISNCAVGLSAWGQNLPVTTSFTNNTVNGPSKAPGSVGAYITTDLISWGYTDAAVNFSGNVLTNNETGVILTAEQQSWNPGTYAEKTINATFHLNQIYGNGDGVTKGGTHGTIINDFEKNWWGDPLGPLAPDKAYGAGDSVVAGIVYSPWCADAACTIFVPPFPTTVTITSDSPDPSVIGQSVTINYSVANSIVGSGGTSTAVVGGPVPVGDVVVTHDGAVVCAAAAIDGSGNGSCTWAFDVTGSHVLTASFTPADASAFIAGTDTETHYVATLMPQLPILQVYANDGGVACRRPRVGVDLLLTDLLRKGGSFDPSTITLSLDGAVVTGDADIIQTMGFPASHASVLYTPPSDLGLGTHQAVLTYPTPSGTQTFTWNFTVTDMTCPGGGGH